MIKLILFGVAIFVLGWNCGARYEIKRHLKFLIEAREFLKNERIKP
jgi:hypothetical protein